MQPKTKEKRKRKESAYKYVGSFSFGYRRNGSENMTDS